MTIDTARCEKCGRPLRRVTHFSPDGKSSVAYECRRPYCTEPAPSAGVDDDFSRWLSKLDEVKQMLRREGNLEAAARVGWANRELLSARSRIAELEKQCETLSRMHKQMCELAIERFERIAELEAVIYPSLHDCGACADIRALLPKESDNG